MEKRILVTGGSGFLGKSLIKHLLKDPNTKITVIDNCISSNEDDFYRELNYHKGIHFLNNDICDTEFMNFVTKNFKFDEIYHLASIASPKLYKKFPLETLDVGYLGTKNVLELARFQSEPGTKFTRDPEGRYVRVLFSSTSECYGDAKETPQRETYYGNVNCFGERSCYSYDTEILTQDGYKLFSELNYTDKVATLNENNELEYNIPDEIIKEKYIGDMYEYKNWNIDLNVTPNHKMYVKKRDYHNFELLPASSKFSWSRAVLKKTCNYIGQEQEWFYFPEHLKNLNNTKKPFVDKVDMDVWVEFMGYYLSEGCAYISTQKKKHPNGKIYENGVFKVHISHSEKVKPLYFEKIKACLDKMPFHYNISRANNSYFVINSKQLALYLKQFGKSQDKFIPADLLSLSKRQLKILLDALMLGDGTLIKNKYKTYYSSSYKLMSNIQEILLKIGTFGNILEEKRDRNQNTMYYMTINYRPERNYTYSKPIVNQYNGYVYCVNVKNHVIFVRRNGKALFCGNCYDESKRVAESLCYTYITSFNLDVKVARIFNTFGPGMDLHDGRIITQCIKSLITNTPLTIYGDGNQTRSLTYISNTINMLMQLIHSGCNTPVNIGNDIEMTVNEIVDTVEHVYQEHFDRNAQLERVYTKLSENDPLQRKPCLIKNKNILGEEKYISIRDGIFKTISYFTKNENENK